MTGLWQRLSNFTKIFRKEADFTVACEIIFEGDSDLHHITIVEENGCRTMYFGQSAEEAETSINIQNPDLPIFEYPGMMLASLPLLPQGHRIAMLGLGGGYLPNVFQKYLPQHQLTVVEVDHLVAELAQIYFGFSPSPAVKLVVDDGRKFLEAQPENSFDQIWLDAFSGNYVPHHLSGCDFLTLCLKRLSPGGLLVQNLHQSRPETFSRQLRHTYKVFNRTMGLDGQRCGNAIIIAQEAKDDGPHNFGSERQLVKAAKEFGR
ncbi:MAG: spermidine synthase, partial [Candidatus Adiutrix sp.]